MFLLDYLYEGHGHIWANGNVEESEVVGAFEHCAFPGSDCWGEFVDPKDAGRQQDGAWWVQIRTRSGKVGWTREAERFDR